MALPLCLSLLFHGLAAGIYFAFLAGRASPVPGWLEKLAPPTIQPPSLAMTLVVMGGEGPETTVAPLAADTAPPPPPPPPSAPMNAEPPAMPPPPAEVAPQSSPPPTMETDTVSSPPAALVWEASRDKPAAKDPVNLPAPTAAGGQAAALSNPAEDQRATHSGLSALSAQSDVGALPGAGAGPSDRASPGNFTGARLRQPPELRRFYPYAARQQAVTGTTHLTLELDAAGRVQSARVLSSQPAGVFDQAAVRAAHALRFEPARRNGQPVPARFDLAIEWRLNR